MKKRVKEPKRHLKRSQLVAEAVAVLCPHCAEPQPNRKDGSEQWTKQDFVGASTTLTCVSCDTSFSLMDDSKVMFQ